MSFFIPNAYAQAAAEGPTDQWFSLGFMVFLFVMFYFIAIRPQRKRQKEHGELVSALSNGDEVVTSAGLLGKVTKVDEDYITLKVADNTELKFQKAAVTAVLPKGTIKAA
ncbi:MAG: preprotein translocase subunit YajC [Pseudomonadales bacterium]